MKRKISYFLFFYLFVLGVCIAQTPSVVDSTFGVNGLVHYPMHQPPLATAGEIKIQPDGKILQVGYSATGNGNKAVIVRYHPDGTLDTTFNHIGIACAKSSSVSITPSRLAQQSNGKIVVGEPDKLSRHNINGTLDTNFGTNGERWLLNLFTFSYSNTGLFAIQSNDKILLPITQGFANDMKLGLMRLDSNGGIDSTFDGDGFIMTNFYVNPIQIVIQSDGKALVMGTNVFNSNDPNTAIVRFNTNGSIDNTFGINGIFNLNILNGKEYGINLCIQSTNKIVVLSRQEDYNNSNDQKIVLSRYDINGSLDNSFGINGHENYQFVTGNSTQAQQALLLPDDRIYVYGISFTTNLNSYGRFTLRFLSNGGIDSSYNGTGQKTILFMNDKQDYYYDYISSAVQNDGKLITSFTSWALQRWNVDGTADMSLHKNGKVLPIVESGIESIRRFSILPNGKMLASDEYLSRFTSEGVLDEDFGYYGNILPTWNLAFNTNDFCSLQDGRIVIGGDDDQIFKIATFDKEGKDFQTYNIDPLPNKNDYLVMLKQSPNGNVIAAGEVGMDISAVTSKIVLVSFKAPNYTSVDLAFNIDGIAIESFPLINLQINDMEIQPDGKILLAMTGHNPSGRNIVLARFTTNGNLDASFGTNGWINIDSLDYWSIGIELTSSGKIILAGGGVSHDILCRFNTDGTFDSTFPNFVNAGVSSTSNDITLQPDEKILVSAIAMDWNNNRYLLVYRFLPTGILDTTFVGGYTYYLLPMVGYFMNKMLVSPTGKIVLAGGANLPSSAPLMGAGGHDFAFFRLLSGLTPTCNESITSSPQNQTSNGTGSVSFSVQVNNPNAASMYQWQSYIGGQWQNVQNNWQYNGANTASLTVFLPNMANNNQQFRCMVTFPLCQDTSNFATLTVLSSDIIQSEFSNIHFVLYPNPTDENMTLDYRLMNSEVISISIMNEQGQILDKVLTKEVKKPDFYQENIQLPQNLSSGKYYLNFGISGKSTVIPFIKR